MLDEARPTLRDAIGNTLIYRKLTYLKSQPLLNWLLVGTLALLVSSLIGRASGELLHPWLYVYVCYAIFAGIPYYSIHALDLFSEAESALQFTFCLNADELHSRLLDDARSTFGYRSIGMWVGGGLVLALGDVTIIALRNHIKHAINLLGNSVLWSSDLFLVWPWRICRLETHAGAVPTRPTTTEANVS